MRLLKDLFDETWHFLICLSNVVRVCDCSQICFTTICNCLFCFDNVGYPFEKTCHFFPFWARALRLQLKRGCSGTDIIQKCTKWSQIGVHGLRIGQISAKFQCAYFLIQQNVKKYKCGSTIRENVMFRQKHFEKLHGLYKNWKKQLIRYNLIKFI